MASILRYDKKMRMSLRTKILGTILTVIIVFGALASYLVYRNSLDSLITFRKEGLLDSTIEKTHEVESVISGLKIEIKTVANQAEVGEMLVNPSKENYAKTKSVLNRFMYDQRLTALYLMDEKGDVLVSTDETLEGNNYSFRDYFKKAITSGEFLEMSIGVTTKKAGYYFSTLVETPEFKGVLVGKVNPEAIHDFVQIKHLLEVYHMLLVDENGVVIYSSDKNKIYKTLGVLTEEEKKSLKEKNKFADLEIAPLGYGEVKEFLVNYQEPVTLVLNDEVDNQNELITIAKVGDYPFFILFEQSLASLKLAARNIGITLAAIVLVAAITAAGLIALVTNQIIGPLKKLTLMAENLNKRNFTKTEVVKTGDELESLARALADASSEIKIYVEETEKKVEERTVDLEKLNSFMVGREIKMIELKDWLKKKK